MEKNELSVKNIDSDEDVIVELIEPLEERATLTVSSYNLCSIKDKDDLKEILEAILKYNSDVLAIQGMTKLNCDYVFRTLKDKSYNFSRFDLSGPPREEFEILFSKIPILKKEYTPFVKSNQNRGLSKYLVKAGFYTQNPFEIYIFTTVLDSGSSGNATRKTQIAEIEAECIKCGGVAIFAGDTSIPSWQQASIKISNMWLDAWREKGTSQNEKTSLYDRMDQIWLSRNKMKIDIEEFSRIRVNSSDETRAGVFAKFISFET